MQSLKPCPVCEPQGLENEILIQREIIEVYDKDIGWVSDWVRYSAGCTNCYEVFALKLNCNEPHDIEDAILAWNKKHD